jgi:hypothetical protein
MEKSAASFFVINPPEGDFHPFSEEQPEHMIPHAARPAINFQLIIFPPMRTTYSPDLVILPIW